MPMGVECNYPSVVALPGYWGNTPDDGTIMMLKYCCTGSEDCMTVDSCNLGRTGPLCGRCVTSKTESLFLPKCVSKEHCKTSLAMFFSIMAALGHMLFLLTFSSVKGIAMKKVKEVLNALKRNKKEKKKRDAFEKYYTSLGRDLNEKSQLVNALLLTANPDKSTQLLRDRQSKSLEYCPLTVSKKILDLE